VLKRAVQESLAIFSFGDVSAYCAAIGPYVGGDLGNFFCPAPTYRDFRASRREVLGGCAS
jgi:hypothetical protein